MDIDGEYEIEGGGSAESPFIAKAKAMLFIHVQDDKNHPSTRPLFLDGERYSDLSCYYSKDEFRDESGKIPVKLILKTGVLRPKKVRKWIGKAASKETKGVKYFGIPNSVLWISDVFGYDSMISCLDRSGTRGHDEIGNMADIIGCITKISLRQNKEFHKDFAIRKLQNVERVEIIHEEQKIYRLTLTNSAKVAGDTDLLGKEAKKSKAEEDQRRKDAEEEQKRKDAEEQKIPFIIPSPKTFFSGSKYESWAELYSDLDGDESFILLHDNDIVVNCQKLNGIDSWTWSCDKAPSHFQIRGFDKQDIESTQMRIASRELTNKSRQHVNTPKVPLSDYVVGTAIPFSLEACLFDVAPDFNDLIRGQYICENQFSLELGGSNIEENPLLLSSIKEDMGFSNGGSFRCYRDTPHCESARPVGSDTRLTLDGYSPLSLSDRGGKRVFDIGELIPALTMESLKEVLDRVPGDVSREYTYISKDGMRHPIDGQCHLLDNRFPAISCISSLSSLGSLPLKVEVLLRYRGQSYALVLNLKDSLEEQLNETGKQTIIDALTAAKGLLLLSDGNGEMKSATEVLIPDSRLTIAEYLSREKCEQGSFIGVDKQTFSYDIGTGEASAKLMGRWYAISKGRDRLSECSALGFGGDGGRSIVLNVLPLIALFESRNIVVAALPRAWGADSDPIGREIASKIVNDLISSDRIKSDIPLSLVGIGSEGAASPVFDSGNPGDISNDSIQKGVVYAERGRNPTVIYNAANLAANRGEDINRVFLFAGSGVPTLELGLLLKLRRKLFVITDDCEPWVEYIIDEEQCTAYDQNFVNFILSNQ